MTARWHPEVLAEADAAAEFYRDKRPELAHRILNSPDEALNRIELHPNIYREIEPGVRKCQLKTFPYAVIFRDATGLEIVAVMHLRRQPAIGRIALERRSLLSQIALPASASRVPR